jgi:hypothetical protein
MRANPSYNPTPAQCQYAGVRPRYPSFTRFLLHGRFRFSTAQIKSSQVLNPPVSDMYVWYLYILACLFIMSELLRKVVLNYNMYIWCSSRATIADATQSWVCSFRENYQSLMLPLKFTSKLYPTAISSKVRHS